MRVEEHVANAWHKTKRVHSGMNARVDVRKILQYANDLGKEF